MFYCRLSKSKQKECLYRLSKPWAEDSAYRFIPPSIHQRQNQSLSIILRAH